MNELTLEDMRWQEADFKKIHGYDWPNCAVPDCEYKSCMPFTNCYRHLTDRERAEHDDNH